MDFSISSSTEAILKEINEFIEKELFPMEREFTGQGFNSFEPKLRLLRDQVKIMGLWAPNLPKDIGGMGLSLMDHGLVSEALGKSPLGHYVFGAQAPDAGNIEILHQYGSAEQKEMYLKPLAAGDIRSCFSMTEPDKPGSNPTEIETKAVKEGDDYIVDGHKWFTSSADGAAFAIVMAVTNPEQAPHMRASMVIVPTDNPGFNLVRNISVMGHKGEGYASHAEIKYESCRIPQTNLLGGEGAGFIIAQERLGPGRIHHCMRWIGICERAFDEMCKRAASRDMGHGKMLGMKQIVQAWIAECRAKINAARLMVLETAWKIDTKGFYAAREDVSLIKFHVAGVMQEVIDRAVQVHGAMGITDDTIVSYYWAHERGARIYDGPDEVHKTVVAKRIMNRYMHGVDSSQVTQK